MRVSVKKNTGGKKFVNDKAVVCNELITDGTNSEMCNAYAQISLPIYPGPYKIKTFCKTANHIKCPVLYFSALINSSRLETGESDDLPTS